MTEEIAKMAIDAFDTYDCILGNETGGIEAPRILISAKVVDGDVTIEWRHPETCGLSDCVYHYLDTSVKEDVFHLDQENNTLTVNGKENIFGKDLIDVSVEIAQRFFSKWKLRLPAEYSVIPV